MLCDSHLVISTLKWVRQMREKKLEEGYDKLRMIREQTKDQEIFHWRRASFTEYCEN